jgi:hypothetical protein
MFNPSTLLLFPLSPPGHTPEMIDLVDSLDHIWNRYGFKRVSDNEAEGSRCEVGSKNSPRYVPLWTDEQLNYKNVSAIEQDRQNITSAYLF